MASTDCNASTSLWAAPPNGSWATIGAPDQVANIDCDVCAVGTHAKLIAGAHYASALDWDESTGQIRIPSCPGMCLTNGQAPGALPSCAGNEPYTETQVHVDSCSAQSTHGWERTALGPAPAAVNATVAAFGAYLQIMP